jgi:hypothetical protein
MLRGGKLRVLDGGDGLLGLVVGGHGALGEIATFGGPPVRRATLAV